jgi:hypothetical protein
VKDEVGHIGLNRIDLSCICGSGASIVWDILYGGGKVTMIVNLNPSKSQFENWLSSIAPSHAQVSFSKDERRMV